MLAFAADWLNLLIRWGHLVAGIGWIGTSFYFIALDLSLKKREGADPAVAGDAWEVHGGGFYHVQKYLTAPRTLPPDLIWFKWEAYLTWLTGFLLLVTQFYWNAPAWLIDSKVMALAPWDAIAISIASLIAGWIVYDGLCRSPLSRNDAALAAAVFVLILAAAYLYTHVYSGRGALVHVGAFIGTLMAVNVFGVIIPNQKKITAALIAGETPDPRLGAVGKQRSVHNTYLTLPVLVMMVSGHYPMLTGHPHAWLLVGLFVLGGAAMRVFLVSQEVGEPLAKVRWTLPIIGASLLAALWLTAPRAGPAVRGAAVSDDEVIAISHKHCVSCHATKPTSQAFTEPPKGVVLETVDEMRRYAALIDRQAVKSDVMPLGNETGMTQQERDKLGVWIAAQ